MKLIIQRTYKNNNESERIDIFYNQPLEFILNYLRVEGYYYIEDLDKWCKNFDEYFYLALIYNSKEETK